MEAEEHHLMLPRRGAAPAIDWFAYNYPPGLQVVHFDLQELRQVVGEEEYALSSLLHRLLRATLVVLVLNVLTTTTLLLLGELYPVALAYSTGNLLLGAAWTLSAMFQGYKGVAIDSPVCRSASQRLLSVCCAGAVIQAFLSGGASCNSNGWFKFRYVHNAPYMLPEVAALWSAFIVLESLLWLLVAALALAGIARLRRYAPTRAAPGPAVALALAPV